MYHLRTLGHLALHEEGPDGSVLMEQSNSLALLGVLALMPGHAARRDYLAQLFWPDKDRTRALQSLRQALYYLGRKDASDVVEADDAEVRLNPDALTTDVWELEEALDAERYEEAVDLYGGHFLEGFERKAGRELRHWIDAENERLRTGVQVAFRTLIQHALSAGHGEDAVKHARAYADFEPLGEQAQRALVYALKEAGRGREALEAYERYATFLRQELDDVPRAELDEMLAEVRDEVLPDRLVPEERGGAASADLSSAPAPPSPSSATAPSPWRQVALGAAIGVLAAPLLWALAVTLFEPDLAGRTLPGLGSSDAASAPILEVRALAPDHTPVLRTARPTADTLRPVGEPLSDERRLLPAPDRMLLAYSGSAPDGKALFLRNPETEEDRQVTHRPDDEWPLAWSPDGRYLLYGFGQAVDEGADYRVGAALYDLRRDAHRVLEGVRLSSRRYYEGVAWSPLGSGLVVSMPVEGVSSEESSEEETDLFLLDLEGRVVRRLTERRGAERSPAWSPAGRELAFVYRREGTSDIWLVGSDGANLRPLTRTRHQETSPVWLSEDEVAFLRRRPGGEPELWAVSLLSGHPRRLRTGELGTIRELRRAGRPDGGGWIRSVRIEKPPELVTPGEVVAPEVVVLDASGRRLDRSAAGVRLLALDSSVARATEDGRLRIRGTGPVRLVADARGWRADTVELRSVPLVPRELEPAFREDWTGGIRPEVWAGFGEPRPYTRPTGGPEDGGVFVNNGDNHFNSGVVSRRTFSRERGITVELWARAPFSGRHYEDVFLVLQDELPPEDPEERRSCGGREGSSTVDLHLRGRLGTLEVLRRDPGDRVSLPLPEEVDRWRLYTLQVGPEGTVTALVDDEVVWRRRGWAPEGLPRQVRVLLAGTSHQTEIFHGPLRVYEGVRWVPAGSGG